MGRLFCEKRMGHQPLGLTQVGGGQRLMIHLRRDVDGCASGPGSIQAALGTLIAE